MKPIFIYSGEFRTFDRCFPNHVATLGQPNEIKWEDTSFTDFALQIDESRKAPECHPPNVLRMWQRRSFIKVREYSESVNICLLRPDIIIDKKINVTSLEMSDNVIYIPTGGDYRDGINDQMAIGSQGAIAVYCSLYNWWEDYYNEGVLFHAETMLKHHLMVRGVEVRRLNTEVKIIREWM